MGFKFNKSAVDQVREEASKVNTHTLLLVGDEESDLSSLSRILSPSYKVITARNGKEGLELIQSEANPESIHLIISEQRMPRMTGIEFLKRTIPIIPETIRMILTGYANIDTVIRSIDDGQIYSFLAKPIEPRILLVTVKRALEAYDLEQKMAEKTMELNEATVEVEEKNRLIKELRDKLEYIAKIDGLTDLPNRRRFDEVLHVEWSRAQRTAKKLSIALIDVDFFKQYNDTYGRRAGDACLKDVAQALSRVEKRPGDFIARYGGGEFVIIMPESDKAAALSVVERMKESVRSLNIDHLSSPVSSYLTISIGLASMAPSVGISPEVLVEKADQMLYEAKAKGRDRIQASI